MSREIEPGHAHSLNPETTEPARVSGENNKPPVSTWHREWLRTVMAELICARNRMACSVKYAIVIMSV
jgi:hypothetical protein